MCAPVDDGEHDVLAAVSVDEPAAHQSSDARPAAVLRLYMHICVK